MLQELRAASSEGRAGDSARATSMGSLGATAGVSGTPGSAAAHTLLAQLSSLTPGAGGHMMASATPITSREP